MVDLDLDLIGDKRKTIKLFGEELPLKNVTVKEHLENELMVQEIEAIPMVDKKSIGKATDMMGEYICNIIEIAPEQAKQITIEQYKAIRKFMGRKEMYDQGFNDKEIDMIEKKALKKQIAQIK